MKTARKQNDSTPVHSNKDDNIQHRLVNWKNFNRRQRSTKLRNPEASASQTQTGATMEEVEENNRNVA